MDSIGGDNELVNQIITIVISIIYYIHVVVLIYTMVMAILASLMAVFQERKIWLKGSTVPALSIWGCGKVFVFNFVWMLLCMTGAVIVFYIWIFTLGYADAQWMAHCLVENKVGHICINLMIGNVVVNGTENLPSNDIYMNRGKTDSPAPVYIANHSSQIDVGVVYFLKRRFKWISKNSVLFLPGVGFVMFLSKHVFINRKKGKNKSSRSNLFDKSAEAVQSGIPMFFFPQGTRRLTEQLAFKDGAFIVAVENKSPLIPISIDIPKSAWNSYYPFFCSKANIPKVIITVHKPIALTGEESKEDLKKQTFETIYSVLPDLREEGTKKEK